jgi:hypothetical protein
MKKEFDGNGLRHTMEELKAIGKKAVFLPVEEMADYVDVMTKNAIDNNDEDFIYKIVSIDSDKTALSLLNATSFGNLAYIKLHCHHEPARRIAEQIIERARNFFNAAHI